jgi:ribosomal protein L13E
MRMCVVGVVAGFVYNAGRRGRGLRIGEIRSKTLNCIVKRRVGFSVWTGDL